MINTKRTKDGAEQDYDDGNLTIEWKHEIDELCDSYDELERKMKIYEPVVCHYAFLEANDKGDDSEPACEALTAVGYSEENPVSPEETIPQMLRRKLKISEDSLQFYANINNWGSNRIMNGGELVSLIALCGPSVAITALKQIRGEL